MAVTPNGHGMGLRRDQLDPRDHKFAASRSTKVAAAPSHDLRHLVPYFLDQGKLGSCTANSSSYLNDSLRALLGLPPDPLARLYQYYNSRVLGGTPNDDSGSSIRDAIQAMVRWGTCPENMWQYDIGRFRERPPEPCYTFGADRQVLEYMRVDQSLGELTGAIYEGHPVIYGMLIFQQFDQLPSHGMVELPRLGERPVGSHSGFLNHYWTDDRGQVWFTDKNTWGQGWGNGGYGHLPAGYILDPQLCDDFWIIRAVETEAPPLPVPPPTPEPLPTPPPPPFNVGPGVLKLMAQLGDRPAGHEKYYPQGPYSKSITKGELYLYEWEELTDTVIATDNNRVIVGTR